MTCAEANRLIGPWVDDELDVRSVAELEAHVGRCAACGREKNELLALRETARERLPREILFLPERNPDQEKWTGRKTAPDEQNVRGVTGFDAVMPA